MQKIKNIVFIVIPIALITLLVFTLYQRKNFDYEKPHTGKIKTSGAGVAMDTWFAERAYPVNNISEQRYISAFITHKANLATRSVSGNSWESLGPQNIGGRTLDLAFHPTNPDIIYAGSASGGLWRTQTRGVGVNAWEYVSTGFPVLGVASVVINPDDPETIIIGTGEVYGSGLAEPGTVNRLTRGTYGIGILKSENGGATWSQVLSFDDNDLKGVSDIEISPLDSQRIFAATTDGVYRSIDGGDNWSLTFAESDCIDIEIDFTNDDIVYVSKGNFNYNLNPNLSGIFKSTNGGMNFTELLDSGLIAAWSGNAKLEIDPSNHNRIYASVQVGYSETSATTPAGVYVSQNAGGNWTKINNQNIARFQGWYSHDFKVNPSNPNEITYVGIDSWRSTDGGNNFVKESAWGAPLGPVPIDVPEGGPNYVHADIHAVYYHPLLSNTLFYATDGGVFSSTDSGLTFTTHNGGLQTAQFYPNMGSSSTNPDFLVAGAQDNNTFIYDGTATWSRKIGGDGMSASVNQNDDAIVYSAFQFIQGLQKSTNGGSSFFSIAPTLVANDYSAFLCPYELAPSNQDKLFAGARYLYTSDNAGGAWVNTSTQPVDGGNVITVIAIDPTNPDVVYLSTAPDPRGNFGTTPKLFKSTNGGQNFTQLTGLPNRFCKDIEIDPTNTDIVYAVFSGFGTGHVFKSTNGGTDWVSIDDNLPDVPTNTILIDPAFPNDIYVGNDLGVYYSSIQGGEWQPLNIGLPDATMIYDLNNSPSNRKLRIATHGHGIWQTNFESTLGINKNETSQFIIFPNPVSEILTIGNTTQPVLRYTIYSETGQKIKEGFNDNAPNVSELSAGLYIIEVETSESKSSKKFIKK